MAPDPTAPTKDTDCDGPCGRPIYSYQPVYVIVTKEGIKVLCRSCNHLELGTEEQPDESTQ